MIEIKTAAIELEASTEHRAILPGAEALLADGGVSDPLIARQLVDELLQAHSQHLPILVTNVSNVRDCPVKEEREWRYHQPCC